MSTFMNFFREGTKESSTRLLYIVSGLLISIGVLIINIKFAINLTKYTGVEIAAILTVDTGFILSLIYGKNKAKEIENSNNEILDK